MLAHAGLDKPQRLVPELIIVTFPPILTHTKEPHLRSSNLNFLSPTIGVRFRFVPGPFRFPDYRGFPPDIRATVYCVEVF